MSQGSLDPKIRFLGQKLWSVARVRRNRQTDGQTDRQTRKWKQRAPFQGFRSFLFNLSSRIGPIHTIHRYKLTPKLISEWNPLDQRNEERYVMLELRKHHIRGTKWWRSRQNIEATSNYSFYPLSVPYHISVNNLLDFTASLSLSPSLSLSLHLCHDADR